MLAFKTEYPGSTPCVGGGDKVLMFVEWITEGLWNGISDFRAKQAD